MAKSKPCVAKLVTRGKTHKVRGVPAKKKTVKKPVKKAAQPKKAPAKKAPAKKSPAKKTAVKKLIFSIQIHTHPCMKKTVLTTHQKVKLILS